MAWKILKQLCKHHTVNRELTLLMETIQKGNENSLIEHHAISLNKWGPYYAALIPTIIVHESVDAMYLTGILAAFD